MPGGEIYPLNSFTQIQDRHISWTGGHDVRVRARAAMVRMLLDPTVQQHIDAMVTHTFPRSQAQEAFELGVSKQCGKVYLLPQE